jgi:hypothetical protein
MAKALKLTALALIGGPIALFVLLVLLAFILALVPFGTIGFIAWRFFAWRTEKERMKRKTEVKLEEIRRNGFPQMIE